MTEEDFNPDTEYSLENFNFLLRQSGVRTVFSAEDLESIEQAIKIEDQEYLRKAFGFALKQYLSERKINNEFNQGVNNLLDEFRDGVKVIRTDALKKRSRKIKKVENRENKIADDLLKQL